MWPFKAKLENKDIIDEAFYVAQKLQELHEQDAKDAYIEYMLSLQGDKTKFMRTIKILEIVGETSPDVADKLSKLREQKALAYQEK